MKKNVWIINHYAGDTFFDNGGRHYAIAKYLKDLGYNSTIFCSNSIHGKKGSYFNFDGLFHSELQEKIGVEYVFVKAREYENNGVSRILNIADFYKNVKRVCKKVAKQKEKPDVIIGSSAHIFDCVAAIKLAKKLKCSSIVEIRDLWPESFVAYGITKEKSLITKYLRRVEKHCYIKSDKIIFTMENAYAYIRERRWDKKIPFSKIAYINNGVDLCDFEYNKDNYKIEDTDLTNIETFKVIYTGSIRKVNDIGLLIDAAKLLKEPKIKLLIWGNGNELEVLKKRVVDEKIDNVVFKGGVEKEYIPYIISKADLNIMHNNDTSITKYGLSLNKMFDYAAAGKLILTDFGKECNPLLIYGAALDTVDNSKEEIANGIMRAFSLDDEKRVEICSNANKCAQDYDYKKAAEKLTSVIDSLSESKTE